MLKTYLVGLTLLGVCASCSPTATLYIVRHAERANDSDTTSLSADGLRRADKLALRLAQVHLDTIYVTPYTRTRQTALPTAHSKGLPLTQYPPSPVTRLTQRIRTFRNKSALAVGHSNTILEIARDLGTTPVRQMIQHGDYANLLIVKMRLTSSGWKATLKEETY
ncbi:SixA phosphatase family protein [Fibrella forsythiae]|uniref:Histidine phosphatase family protein n=1 Tax=Fibrella forsythiae TaxID=2817061 RepID=A0ABS3JG51_9BACT|nr:phosphoglycerate mutase family protein [Fibrella forsythiae]MBO0948979.1 histidine phosphatase family protein [Fibrella forsythiae]